MINFAKWRLIIRKLRNQNDNDNDNVNGNIIKIFLNSNYAGMMYLFLDNRRNVDVFIKR